jgi:hypothetical protein
MFRIILAVMALFLVSACSRSIDGSFEYSVGGNIMKANEAEIQIVPFDEFKKYVESIRPLLDEKIKSLEKNIELEKSSLEKIQHNQKNVFNAMIGASGTVFNMNTLGGQYMHQQRDKNMATASGLLDQASSIVDKHKSNIKEFQTEIDFLKEGKYAPATFPRKNINGSIKVKTNTKGEFSFELKDDGKYIVIAERGNLYWFVPIKQKDKFIKLSSANYISKFCEICSPGSIWPE